MNCGIVHGPGTDSGPILKRSAIENGTCYGAGNFAIALRSYSINLGCKLAESAGSEIFENAKGLGTNEQYSHNSNF